MEMFGCLIGLAAMAAFLVLPIITLVKISMLRGELRDLRSKMDVLQGSFRAKEQPGPDSSQPGQAPAPVQCLPHPEVIPLSREPLSPPPVPEPPNPSIPPAAPPSPPVRTNDLGDKLGAFLTKVGDWLAVRGEFAPKGETWEYGLATNWLLRVGVIIVLGGVLFFLRWSIEHGLLGPAGRVAISLSVGVALIAVGSRMLFKSYHLIAQGLCCIGFVTLYFGFYAAVGMYHLFGPAAGQIAFICVTIGAGVFAVAYRSAAIATLGLLGGYLAPVLMNTGSQNDIAFYTYLLVLGIAALVISRLRKWPALNLLAMLAGYFLCAAFCDQHGGRDFLFRGFVFFCVVHLLYLASVWIYKRGTEKMSAMGWVALCFNAVIYITWMLAAFRPVFSNEWVGLVFIGVTAVYVAFAYTELRRKSPDSSTVRVMVALAMAFLAFAPALLFNFTWLAFAWALQAVAMAYVAKTIRQPLLCAFAYLLIVVAGATAFYWCVVSYPVCWDLTDKGTPGSGRYIVGIVLRILKIGSIPAAFAVLSYETEAKTVRRVLVGAALVSAWLFASCEAWMAAKCYLPEFRMGAVTLTWTLFAIGLLSAGIANRSAVIRKAGLFLFFLSAAKLLVVDLAKLETIYRVVASIAVGVLLVLGSFLYIKFRNAFKIEETNENK
jgi:uncharacterized membrane protein